MTSDINKVAYQGTPGAYHEAAALMLFPGQALLPCATFPQVFEALVTKQTDRAVIAIENIIAGRVADVHTLLPRAAVFIVGEYFHPIEHHLLAIPGATLANIKTALSQEPALHQCRTFLTQHNITPAPYHDTAAAAAQVAGLGDATIAAIASARAGELHGLQSLASNIADHKSNVTRFLVLAREAIMTASDVPCLTTLLFTLRSVPAALHKALGCFATNGINLTKIESYLAPDDFTSATFYVDIEAHPATAAYQHALDELKFYTTRLDVLGTYPAARG